MIVESINDVWLITRIDHNYLIFMQINGYLIEIT